MLFEDETELTTIQDSTCISEIPAVDTVGDAAPDQAFDTGAESGDPDYTNPLPFDEHIVPLRGLLMSVAKSLTRSGHRVADADDLVQRTMMKAWQAWPRFRAAGDGDIRHWVQAWLCLILRRENINHAVRYSREMRSRDDLAAIATPLNDMTSYSSCHTMSRLTDSQNANMSQRLIDGQYNISDEVRHAIEHLSDDHRAVIELYYFECFSIEQICAQLDVLSKNTIKTRLLRAREILIKHLYRYAGRTYKIGVVRQDITEGSSTKDASKTTKRVKPDARSIDGIVIGLDT